MTSTLADVHTSIWDLVDLHVSGVVIMADVHVDGDGTLAVERVDGDRTLAVERVDGDGTLAVGTLPKLVLAMRIVHSFCENNNPLNDYFDA